LRQPDLGTEQPRSDSVAAVLIAVHLWSFDYPMDGLNATISASRSTIDDRRSTIDDRRSTIDYRPTWRRLHPEPSEVAM
jgi:hypothetical protein